MAKAIPAREAATSGADGGQIKKRRMKALLKTQQRFYASPQKCSRPIQRFYIGNKAQISIKNPDCALTVGVFRRKISTLFLLRQSTIALYRFQTGFGDFSLKPAPVSVCAELYLPILLNTGIAVIGVSTG